MIRLTNANTNISLRTHLWFSSLPSLLERSQLFIGIGTYICISAINDNILLTVSCYVFLSLHLSFCHKHKTEYTAKYALHVHRYPRHSIVHCTLHTVVCEKNGMHTQMWCVWYLCTCAICVYYTVLCFAMAHALSLSLHCLFYSIDRSL